MEGAKQKDVGTATTSKWTPLPLQVEAVGVTRNTLVHFEGSTSFAAYDLWSSLAEKLERNTYGTDYRVILKDGDQVAVNRIRKTIVKQKELEMNLNLLGKIRHPNLLAMKAYYFDINGDKLLVSDYMPKGSLALFLNGEGSKRTAIDWPTRMHIAKGIARGLLSLHTEHKIIHGNLTSSNVMLDENNNPKIANFGLSQLLMADHDYSKVNATPGTVLSYRAPEISDLKKANTKTDVYSLGVIMLELLTAGKLAYDVDSTRWVKDVPKEQYEDFDLELLAMDCTNLSPLDRPDVYLVLQQLETIRP